MNFLIIIMTFFSLQCSSETVDKRNANWLTSINNTEWVNSPEKIVFNSSGESATGGGINYVYAGSETSDSGLYETDIAFPPSKWYLFKKTSQLYRYGPFLYRKDVNTNDSSLTTIFIEQ